MIINLFYNNYDILNMYKFYLCIIIVNHFASTVVGFSVYLFSLNIFVFMSIITLLWQIFCFIVNGIIE